VATIKDSVCLAHSGVTRGVESNGRKLDHVITLLEAQQASILNNDRRITKIYTVVAVLGFVGGSAFSGLTIAVKQGWL
jgi:hypothetical protein